MNLKEQFSNGWKKWILSKRDRRLKAALKNASKNPMSRIGAANKIRQGMAPRRQSKLNATVMFVPKT